jgi:hypothetical protein
VGSFRPLPVRISSEISVEIPGRREPQPTLWHLASQNK